MLLSWEMFISFIAPALSQPMFDVEHACARTVRGEGAGSLQQQRGTDPDSYRTSETTQHPTWG